MNSDRGSWRVSLRNRLSPPLRPIDATAPCCSLRCGQEWSGTVFHVLLGRTDIKARHLRHDPRVGIVVYEQTPPYRGVEAAGTATLIEGMHADLLGRMGPRYLPDGLPDVLARDGLVLVLTPSRLRSWSFASWFWRAGAQRGRRAAFGAGRESRRAGRSRLRQRSAMHPDGSALLAVLGPLTNRRKLVRRLEQAEQTSNNPDVVRWRL